MKKNKSAYAQANKDWLVEKSKENGVMALPKGVYYKVLAEGDHSGATPTPGNVIPPITQARPSMASSSTAAVAKCPWLSTARPHRGLDYRHAADAHR